MQPKVDGGPSAAESLEAAQKAERKGLIPSLANIENDKVYIFTGTMDTTVNPVASAATRSLYTNLGVKGNRGKSAGIGWMRGFFIRRRGPM